MIGHLPDFDAPGDYDHLTETEQHFRDLLPTATTSADIIITQFEVDCAHADWFLGVLEQDTKTYEAGSELAFESARDSALEALGDFDHNWEQIVKAQAWAVDCANLTSEAWEAETAQTRTARELCSSFSARGAALLSLRQAPEDRIRWSTAALTAARSLGDKALECTHLNHIGLSYTELGRYEEARQCYQQVIAIADHYGEAYRYAGRAYINLALTCGRAGEYKNGIDYCDKAIASARRYHDLRDEGKAQNILGEIYRSLGKIDKAFEHCEKARQLAHDIRDFRTEANAIGSLGNIYLKHYFDFNRAIDQYEQALAIYDRLGDQRGKINAHAMLGEAYRSQRDIDQAWTHFNEAYRIAGELNSLYHRAGLHFYMALLCKDQRQWQKALDHAQKSLEFFEDIHMRQMVQEASKLIEQLS